MLEHAITHIASIAGDESIKVVIDAALKPVGTVITNAVRRRFHLRGDDIAEMRVEVERLEETLQTFERELHRRAVTAATAPMNAEAQEPSFSAFVDRAFTISANTTLESKRRLAGAFIARRLSLKTDSSEEIQLRRALSTMEDLTENQLLMLAAAHLVIFGPQLGAEHRSFESRDALEAHLQPRYFPVVHNLYDSLRFDEDDFSALASVGAARLLEDTGALLVHERASRLQMWMTQLGISAYDGLEGEWGSSESQDAFRARFPTITLLSKIAEGKSHYTKDNRRRLDEVILTLGITIGELVLQQLGGRDAAADPTHT